MQKRRSYADGGFYAKDAKEECDLQVDLVDLHREKFLPFWHLDTRIKCCNIGSKIISLLEVE
jgi:hypothetical protein